MFHVKQGVKMWKFAILFSLLASPVWACMFSTDCYPGSVCVRGDAELYGVCTGGIRPGNAYDERPNPRRYGIEKPKGNTCRFNSDCGPGFQCVGQGVYGICVSS